MNQQGERRAAPSATRSSATAAETAAFVEQTFIAFDSAFLKSGSGHQVLDLADQVLRVNYVGSDLRGRLSPAIAHLERTAAEEDLTISCWDGRASTVPLPTPPWRSADFLGDSRIRGHIAGPLVATYDADGHLFQLFDRPGRRALFFVAHHGELPDWHDRSPFRPLISMWAEDRGLALLHGATVASGGKALVVAGVSGSGKSTTAMTCLLAGLDFLGDDACLVDARSRTVSSVFGRAKLEPDAADRLGSAGRLAAHRTVRRSDGAMVVEPERVLRRASLSVVLLAALSGQPRTEVSSALPVEVAVAELGETVREENRGLRPAAVAAIRSVAETFPVRRISVGTDPAHLVACLRRELS